MRTTLDLPEGLIEEARRLAHLRTKSETVVAALDELIRKAKRDQLRKLAGRVELDLDLNKARKRSR